MRVEAEEETCNQGADTIQDQTTKQCSKFYSIKSLGCVQECDVNIRPSGSIIFEYLSDDEGAVQRAVSFLEAKLHFTCIRQGGALHK